MPIVDVRDLTRTFHTQTVLQRITLSVEAGEIFGLIGPDAAGKTTLLRILAGVLTPTAGAVQVCGIDMRREPEAVKNKIGVMPQNFSLYPDLSVEENLSFFRRMYHLSESDFRARRERLLGITRLETFLKRRADQLSGGMQKKLGLAVCLLHTPELLLLDEPTTGVDPVSRRELWDFLYELHGQGITIIITTPYMDEAERCDRVGFLYRSELLALETPARLKSAYPYPILMVNADDPQQLRRLVFSGGMGVVDSYLVGAAWHVVLKHPDSTGVESWLQTNGIKADLRFIEPSFEDAFIDLIRRQAGSPRTGHNGIAP